MSADLTMPNFDPVEPHWFKIKAIGLLLLGISATLTPIAVIQVGRVAETLAHQQDCELELSSDMRRAIGRGLAAVADGDDQTLEVQANILRRLAEQEC